MRGIREILRDRYGIDPISAKKLSVGVGADTYVITAKQGKYIFKRPDPNEMNGAEREPEICDFLRERGFRVSEFLRNREGSFITTEEGVACHLQRFVEGENFYVHSASEGLLSDMAETLGKIHAALLGYPPLPEGIGAGFFETMTPERALESSLRSLRIAEEKGDSESAEELRWRIGFYERYPLAAPDIRSLTVVNTHGDYFITQLLCQNDRIAAVIDWTSACRHPAIWEVFRSWLYADPACKGGLLPPDRLIRYVRAYQSAFPLTARDIESMAGLYFYQIAVCDYYGQYYASTASNRHIFLDQARYATRCMKRFEAELAPLTEALVSALA